MAERRPLLWSAFGAFWPKVNVALAARAGANTAEPPYVGKTPCGLSSHAWRGDAVVLRNQSSLDLLSCSLDARMLLLTQCALAASLPSTEQHAAESGGTTMMFLIILFMFPLQGGARRPGAASPAAAEAVAAAAVVGRRAAASAAAPHLPFGTDGEDAR